MKQTRMIKEDREKTQQAWNTSVKQCKLSERANLNHKNFKLFFQHASQYRLVHNAYYALLNDYRRVGLKRIEGKEVCLHSKLLIE